MDGRMKRRKNYLQQTKNPVTKPNKGKTRDLKELCFRYKTDTSGKGGRTLWWETLGESQKFLKSKNTGAEMLTGGGRGLKSGDSGPENQSERQGTENNFKE